MQEHDEIDELTDLTLARATEVRRQFLNAHQKPETLDSAKEYLVESVAQAIAHAGFATTLMMALGVPQEDALEAVAMSVRSYADMDAESLAKWRKAKDANKRT